MAMARLRHFAVCVKDLDKAAEFYAKVFDLKRVGREDLEIGSAIYMTDGVINLALLNFKGTAASSSSISATSATAISSASSRIPTG
jgi:catechol 2,3-dioxygenase-like lactoylglutathione lyase family enzyme